MTTRFKLREILTVREMSQAELSKRSGVAKRTIVRLCMNTTGQVSLDTLDRIAAALGIAPGEIIEQAPASKRRR